MKLLPLERQSECRKCGAKIGFVRTVKGKWMPVEPEPTTLEQLELGWSLVTPAGETWKRHETVKHPDHFKVEGYACHFDTCKG